MQYIAVTFLPDDNGAVAGFDYANVNTNNGNAILCPASQALKTINRLSRDEGWELFQVDIEDMAQGAGVIILQRNGNVPAGW